jgi:Zn-finger nucleic acid-binding protein
MSASTCPRCGQMLSGHVVATGSGKVTVDVCAAGCGGFWVDNTDVESGIDVSDDLLSLQITPTLTPDLTQPVACPTCEQPMIRYRWNYTSPVTLDQCPDGHGTWIDAGEVQAMEEFEESEVLSEEKKRRLEERLGVDRAEIEADLSRNVGRTSNWLLSAIERVWGRYL